MKLKQFAVAALIMACSGIAQAASFTCYWVGQVYQTPVIDGMGGSPAFHTWGDSAGWSIAQGTVGGTCPGGTPQNGTFTYNAVIANANATAFLSNVGQTSLVQVVTNGQPISPTISSLNITSSTLDFDASTLTVGTLSADGAHINGGHVAVSGAGGVNTLNNMYIDSTMYDFSGDSSSSSFTGSLQLARIAAGSGKNGTGGVNYGVPPILASSGNAALNFSNVILYGQDPSTASLGLIQSNGTTPVAFTGTNNILGTVLQGQFAINSGNTTFVQANNQGTLTAQSGGALYFNNGMMTQAAGSGAPGFTQSGTGMIFANDLTATSGTFNGLIHLNGDGLGGGAYDNTLTGVTVNTGGTLSLETGATSFTGSNQGTLVTNGGSLTLTGPVDNNDGSIQNVSGHLTLQDASVSSGSITGDLSTGGTSSMNGLSYSNGILSPSGSLILNSVNVTSATIGGDVRFSGNNLLNSTTLTGTGSIIDGSTTFQGVNHGILIAETGSLTLAGSVENTGGEFQSQAGGVLAVDGATVTNGRITGNAGSSGNSMLSGVEYRGGILSAVQGNLTLQDVVNNGIITSAGGNVILSGHVSGGSFNETATPPSHGPTTVTPTMIQLNAATVSNAAISGALSAMGSNTMINDVFGAGSLAIASGSTTLAGGVVFNQNFLLDASGGGQLNNNQTLSNAPGATLTFSGAIVNSSGGGIVQQGTRGIAFNNASVSGGSIGNGGTFDGANSLTSVTLGGTSNITSGSTSGAGIVNQGIVNAIGGAFVLSGANQTGTINGYTAQSVQLNGASLTGGQINGGLIANGTNTFSGVQLSGTLEVDGGKTYGAGLTFTGANPAYLVRGGTLALSTTTSVPVTVNSGGELDLSGTPTVTGVTSAGYVKAVSGTSTLNALSTSGGTLRANSGATLTLSNATIQNTALVSNPLQVIPGCGGLCVTLIPAGTLQTSGLTTISNSNLSGGDLTVAGGTTSLLGAIGMATSSRFIAGNGGTLDLIGATVTGGGFATAGTGVVQVFGQNYLFGSGSQGNFNSSFNGALAVVGSDWVLSPGATTLIGESGTLALTSGEVHNEGGLIDVGIGGVLSVPTTFVQDSGSTVVHGTLHAGSSAAPGDIDINGGTFVYDSTIDLFGNLNFSNSAAGLVVNNSHIFGSVTLGANSMIEGSHAISGDLVNGGEVQPGDAPGIISIGGNYSQQAGGTLTIQLGGTDAAAPDFDQLMIAGRAHLDGTLDLTSWNGFQPVAGESFRILQFANEIGMFSSVDLMGIADSNYRISYDAQDVTVTFGQSPSAPEPSTWMLIAGGLGMLGLSRRRRREGSV